MFCTFIHALYLKNQYVYFAFLQVSYPPYIFECFLHAEVDDDKSTAEVNNALVLFKLEKVEPVIWTQLQCDKAGEYILDTPLG